MKVISLHLRPHPNTKSSIGPKKAKKTPKKQKTKKVRKQKSYKIKAI